METSTRLTQNMRRERIFAAVRGGRSCVYPEAHRFVIRRQTPPCRFPIACLKSLTITINAMCGIAGTIGPTAALAGAPAREIIKQMCDVIEHRGPDDWGFRVENLAESTLAIGMRRLSIIDVARGRQPISQRRRHGVDRLQRRNLQLPRTARRADRARPPVRDAERHRDHRPPLRRRGRALRRAVARDVQLCHLGRAATVR